VKHASVTHYKNLHDPNLSSDPRLGTATIDSTLFKMVFNFLNSFLKQMGKISKKKKLGKKPRKNC